MVAKRCDFEGCDRPVSRAGLCGSHYRQKLEGSELRPLRPREKRPVDGKCTVKDCDKPWRNKGFCTVHYERVRRHGSTELPEKEVTPKAICKIEQCDRESVSKGMCDMHYGRTLKGKPAAKPKPICKGCGSDTRKLSKPGPRCVSCYRQFKKDASYRQHDKYLRAEYGITAEDYWALYESQGGRCQCCHRATGRSKRLHMEHDHLTGELTGLVCGVCNRILGHIRRDGSAADRIAEYVASPPSRELWFHSDEVWRPVVDNWAYEVSSHGRVRTWITAGSNSGMVSESPRTLAQGDNGHGYKNVMLGRDNRVYVHKLVAHAFLGPNPDGMHVCHNDGDRENNRADNLRYDTPQENARDIHRMGRGNTAVFTEETVMQALDMALAGDSIEGIAEKFGVSNSSVRNILRGETWQWVPHEYRGMQPPAKMKAAPAAA